MVIVIINLLGLFMPRVRIKGGGPDEMRERRKGSRRAKGLLLRSSVIRHHGDRGV